jgi:hypothetical protein
MIEGIWFVNEKYTENCVFLHKYAIPDAAELWEKPAGLTTKIPNQR